MKRVGKVLLVVVLVLAATVAGVVLFFRRSLPELSGEVAVTGVSGPVEIVRDHQAIPHIYATSTADAYFGLGYVHAQDRLWQMELNRRLGSGTLSEVFGEDTLGEDRLFRTLGLRRVAEENVEQLAAGTRVALDSYVGGVNAFLSERRPLPPEFVFFGVEPRSWTPVDCLVWQKVMAWSMSGNWETELFRLRLSRRLSPSQISEFLAPYPGDKPFTLPALLEQHGAIEQAAGALMASATAGRDRAIGSNNWAIDGSRTRSGKPLLANDPHLELYAPSLWYFAHLNAPGLNVIGATLPSLPGVLLGRNDHVAWAFANTRSDTQDLFIEKLVPSDPSRYLTPSGSQPFTVFSEVIKVNGKSDEVLPVRITRHGPVISDVSERAKHLMPEGQVLALSWVALRSDDRTVAFSLNAAEAKDAGGLLSATRDFHSPQQNIVYADTSGTIGFIAAGRVPIRRPGNDVNGLIPVPGWVDTYDWIGLVPWEDLPQTRDPTRGQIVTANNKITPERYAYWIGSEWDHPCRAERIEALLDATSEHSVESFAKIQMDVSSGAAEILLPELLRADVSTEEERRIVERLRAWNGEMRADAAEPLIFAAWVREVSRQIYEDDLGDLFRQGFGERLAFLHNVLSDVDHDGHWCDDIRTDRGESCHELIGHALKRAIAYLNENYGDDPAAWSWGKAHPARSEHTVLGGIPVLSRWFNVVVKSSGDNETVNLGGYSISQDKTPFVSHEGPGFRAIYDLGDPERSLFVLNTGESGHPLSRYYRDQSEPWAAGGYMPMMTLRSSVERESIGTLRLVPR